jgi:hypothetical protein
MAGIKGRSGGKATTLEAKQLKSAATAAREARKREIAATKTALGPPVTYGDLLKSAQVDGELLQNDRRAIEVQRAEVELARAQDERDIARGLLITQEDHLAQAKEIVDRILSHLPIIVDAALAQHPPERQPTVRHALDQAVRQFREAAASAVKSP